MAKRTQHSNLTLVKRVAPYRGPTNSEDWNDCFDEILNSFNIIADRLNNSVVPLHALLPDGTDDSEVNAFKDGLDGRTLYVDASLTSLATDQTYYNSSKVRPFTLKEALDNLYSYVDTQDEAVQEATAALVSPLTTGQKAAIGMNIFDATKVSSSTSLDGKSENNRLNIIQIAQDLYDTTSYSLDNDGSPNLTLSVRDMVSALLGAHGGTWDADISLVHSGITANQVDIGASTVYNDAFVGAPVNTQEDLNQIRTRIREIAGTVGWTSALPALYLGGADSLFELLATTAGTGTKAATNPWGYAYGDIDNMNLVLANLQSFTGQTNVGDAAPTYTSNDFVVNGTSLETAIGTLDDGLGWAETPGEFKGVEQFRRMEWGLSGVGQLCTHNKNSYPTCQLIQVDPNPAISGIVPHYFRHASLNQFELVITSGVVVSGAVVAQW